MDLDKPIILMEKVIIPAFALQIVKARMKKTFMQGHWLNVMVQPPYLEDEVRLPVGLYVQHIYMELKDGSQSVSTMLRKEHESPYTWLVEDSLEE